MALLSIRMPFLPMSEIVSYQSSPLRRYINKLVCTHAGPMNSLPANMHTWLHVHSMSKQPSKDLTVKGRGTCQTLV